MNGQLGKQANLLQSLEGQPLIIRSSGVKGVYTSNHPADVRLAANEVIESRLWEY